MLLGTNLAHAKRHNIQIVYETVRLFGPISRADVARRTQLTAQTISNLVRELLDNRLVVETDRHTGGRGAPSIRLEVNPQAGYAIGLDLDVDHLTAVLVDLSGAVLERVNYDLVDPTPDEAVAVMSEAACGLLQRHGLSPKSVWGAGVGVPGPMVPSPGDADTYVVSPWALSGWRDVPLAEHLHERLELPVFIENNATAAAVGEHWYGAGRHLSTFFYVYLGSGLGGGLVVQGHPFEGHSGNAGEVGYLPPFSPAGATGTSRHLGELFNLRQLYARLRAAGEEAAALDDLTALFHTERPALMRWLDEAAEQLAFVLLAAEYFLDPEAIVIGGRWPDVLLDALRARAVLLLPDRRIAGKRSAPAVHLATAGIDAGALGVATLPFYSAFAPTSRIALKRADSVDAGPPSLTLR
jgi:predicted NBD/HSP70 family sugar kinase